MTFLYTDISHRTVLSVIGSDWQPFLQGLVTADMGSLWAGKGIAYTWLLTPTGRFDYDFFVIGRKDGDGVYLTPEVASAPDLLRLLTLYKMRSNVCIRAEEEKMILRTLWGTGEQHLPRGLSSSALPGYLYPDPRCPQLGFVALFDAGEIPMWEQRVLEQGGQCGTQIDFDRHRVQWGIPDGMGDLVRGRSFPLEVPEDAFGAISFGKGCYLGQELVARTKHQGQVQKMILPFQTSSCDLKVGHGVYDDQGQEVGKILSVYPMDDQQDGQKTACGFMRVDGTKNHPHHWTVTDPNNPGLSHSLMLLRRPATQ